MQCRFRYVAGEAVCDRCGRRATTMSRNLEAQCRLGGPGSELSSILSGWPFYITITPGCRCKSHAETMDMWGCDRCEDRIDEIVGWLRGEAATRGMPFSAALAKALIRRAIYRARAKLA